MNSFERTVVKPIQRLYRSAYQACFGYPTKGQALDIVKELVTPDIDAIQTAVSLSQARLLLDAWIESTAEVAALPETERAVKDAIRFAHSLKEMEPDTDVQSFVRISKTNKFELETKVQRMILSHRKKNLVQAERLIHALLEHPRGPRIGYNIYLDNVRFDKIYG